MKSIFITLFVALLMAGCKIQSNDKAAEFTTICNPIDINYRFCLDEPSRREAADPTVIWYRDRYYLFASKSGGYWHSADLSSWTFIETNEIPTEEYAPTAVVIEDTLYFLASSNELSTLYKSSQPELGKWEIAVKELDMPVWDPAFLLDDDNRLYLFWGCSDINPIYGVELDYKNGFRFIGKPQELIKAQTETHGWEVPGDHNTRLTQKPWIEGPWMNKIWGKYYLQYSGPGTEYRSYCDAVYTADNPLGPFQLQPHNPFAYKPAGFATGAGHGSTFTDKYGNYWHMGTITISQKHIFERRLALYPTFVDADGTLFSQTQFGDYPMMIPQKKIENSAEIFPQWMVLSYNKPVEASSAIDSLPTRFLVDEDIRTYWAAQSGQAGEFVVIDLESPCDIFAIQVNFAEHGTHLFGRNKSLRHRYTVEYSTDKIQWNPIIDQSESTHDNSHAYHQLETKITGRYIKLTNYQVPDGHFAVSGLRIFGNALGSTPSKVADFQALRNIENPRTVTLNWSKAEAADGYCISYGNEKNKRYHSYMVYGDTSVTINSLNADLKYFFSIESFNENGRTPSEMLIEIP